MRSGGAAAALMVGLVATVACGGSSSAPTTSTGDLSDAARSGDASRVEALLGDGANPDGPVHLGLTPLMRAANGDHADVVRALLAGGADVDGEGSGGLTALHVAAAADAVAATEALLEEGADPRIRSDSGMSPLDAAADAGALGSLRLLADHVDVDRPSGVVTQGHGHPRDTGPTPLAIAARAGRIAAVDLLLRLGADVDARSAAGHTALLTAVFSDSSLELVEVLLAAGADPTVSVGCDRGCSATQPGEPLDAAEWARALDREDLVPLLDRGGR